MKNFQTINKLNQVETKRNIAFFNFRCELVNKYIHLNRMKTPEGAILFNEILFYTGLDLVCKTHYKNKNCILYTNYEYKLIDINIKTFTIIEPVENIKMTFELKILKHFKLPYCNTVHSVQGLSIDEKITVFDCNTPYTKHNFVWIAITRVRYLNNVIFF